MPGAMTSACAPSGKLWDDRCQAGWLAIPVVTRWGAGKIFDQAPELTAPITMVTWPPIPAVDPSACWMLLHIWPAVCDPPIYYATKRYIVMYMYIVGYILLYNTHIKPKKTSFPFLLISISHGEVHFDHSSHHLTQVSHTFFHPLAHCA